MLEIRKTRIQGGEYFAIFIDDECYMQRAEIIDAPRPGEKALIRVCEYIVSQQNAHQ